MTMEPPASLHWEEQQTLSQAEASQGEGAASVGGSREAGPG